MGKKFSCSGEAEFLVGYWLFYQGGGQDAVFDQQRPGRSGGQEGDGSCPEAGEQDACYGEQGGYENDYQQEAQEVEGVAHDEIEGAAVDGEGASFCFSVFFIEDACLLRYEKGKEEEGQHSPEEEQVEADECENASEQSAEAGIEEQADGK